MVTAPELTATTIVTVGEFSPQIFRPEWFMKTGLISTEEAMAAEIEIISPDITVLKIGHVQVLVERDKLQVGSALEPVVQVMDFASGVLSFLGENPVSAFGINNDGHHRLGTNERWHEFGHRLAPKEPWGDFYTNYRLQVPGMRSLTLEFGRAGPPKGYVRATVQPSVRVPTGVYISINDHYELGGVDLPANASDAAAAMRDRWEPSVSFSEQVRQHLLGGPE